MNRDFVEVRVSLPDWAVLALTVLLVAFAALKVYELVLRYRIRREEHRLEELRREAARLRVTVHDP